MCELDPRIVQIQNECNHHWGVVSFDTVRCRKCLKERESILLVQRTVDGKTKLERSRRYPDRRAQSLLVLSQIGQYIMGDII